MFSQEVLNKITSCNLTLEKFYLKNTISLLLYDENNKNLKLKQKTANEHLQKLIDQIEYITKESLEPKDILLRCTLLQEADIAVKEVRKITKEDLDLDKVESQITNHKELIEEAITIAEKRSSNITQNVDLQQNNNEINKLFQGMINLQKENQEQIKMLGEMQNNQLKQNQVQTFSGIKIAITEKIFKFELNFKVAKMDKLLGKNFDNELEMKITKINNEQLMMGIYRLAQQIDIIVELTAKHETDVHHANMMVEKIFGYDLVNSITNGWKLMAGEKKLEAIIKTIIIKGFGENEISSKLFLKNLVEKNGMKEKEKISQWLIRFKSCTRNVNQKLSDEEMVEYFFIGTREDWKSKHPVQIYEAKKSKNLDLIGDEELEEELNNNKKHIEVKRNNKNNSNYFGTKPQITSSNENKKIMRKNNNNNKNKIESDYSNIFNIWEKKRVEFLEKRIKKDQGELERNKEMKSMKRGKLYIEISDVLNRKYKFLIDSGSPVHVIKSEIVKQYNLPFKEKKYHNYRGVGNDPKVDMIGVCKNHYKIGTEEPAFILFLVANNFPENILSWQKLIEVFGKILWMESDKGRLIAIGSTQFIEDEDGIFRPRNKIDMQKVIKKIDDSRENEFELDKNQYQLSDPTPSLNAKIKEQNEEIIQMKTKIHELQHLSKVKKPTKETKNVKCYTVEIVYESKGIQEEKIEMQEVKKEEEALSEAEEFLASMRNLHEKGTKIEKEQFEEQVKKVREKYSQFEKENIEEMLEQEEKLQQEEFVEEITENKQIAKEEFNKLLEEINLVRQVTKANKKETYKHKETKEQRKKLKKEEKKRRLSEMKEMEEFICNIRDLTEDEKQELFEHTRKVAKYDPKKNFSIWKEELEKGMFNKQEMYQIWKDMQEEDKFPKEQKPWINDFDAWADHVLRNLECSKDQKTKFKEGIKRLIQVPPPTFKQTFENNEGIGVEIEIDPNDYNKEPVWYMMQNKIEAAKPVIDAWLEAGYIEEIEEKDAKCIVNLVVQIKEGKIRVCMDYSRQNKFVKNDYGSFLSVDEVIDRLNPDHKVGFVIDLKGAFHNVLLSEESKKLCCFYFDGKVYCFKVLFFGISCGPYLFNEFLRKRLGTEKDILKYIDDLICTKKSVEELLESFLRLVDLIEKYHIAISPEKLQFGPRLKILGQYWDEGKLQMDINKLIALRYVTVIQNQRDLNVNLGMFRFIAKFTKGLNEKLQYFYKKCHDKLWSWTRNDAERLIKIWLEIESNSVLWTLDPNKEVVLRTDAATKKGIGFSILQYDENGFEKYIVHYSKALSEVQKNYSPIDLEAYTIILALDKFYKYFIGHKFRIETDAKSLVNIFNQVAEEKASKRIWRWTYIIMQFQFYVVHIRGINNTVSDWMSKNPVNIEKFYQYLEDMLSKNGDEQLGKRAEKNVDTTNEIDEPEPKTSKPERIYNMEETIYMLEEIGKNFFEGKVKESGDNYMSPTWTLIFILHNVFKKYMDIDTYEKHCLEIDRLLEEKDEKKRDKDVYLYILTKVVYDPCPIRENVQLGSKEDGLNKEIKWRKLNFVNCPYSMELLKRFIERCIEEKRNGNTSVLLISFKYSMYLQKLLFKQPVQWDTLSILPSISFGKENKGKTFFPAMLLIEFDGTKKNNTNDSFIIDNLKMRKGIVFRISKNHAVDPLHQIHENVFVLSEDSEEDGDIMELNQNEKIEHEELTEDDEIDSKEIDDGIDLDQFDGYNPGFNQDLDVRFEQEQKMFEPSIEIDGIDAYEAIVRCLLEGKKLTGELEHPRYNLIRKQAEHYLKHHQIINDRLCYVDPKRLDKYNKGVRYYVRVADRFKIFRIAHELNGHLSIGYVMNYSQDFWWPNMYTHLQEKIESCHECQRFKKTREQDKVVNTTPFYEPFQCGHIDLIGKLPGKYKYGFVYNDHCTKYTIAIAIKTKDMDKIADIIIRKIFYVVGFVELIVHDRGSEFCNKLIDAIFKKIGVRVRMTSVRHSSANMVERKNKIIGQMIRCLVYDHHENWYKFLPEVVFAMNTYIPKGLWNSAFELTFGRKPWTLLDLVMDNKTRSNDKNINKWYQRFKYWIATNKALEWELRKKNQKTTGTERFKVGDIVKIAGEDLYYNSGSKKLQPYQSGPYKILEIKNGSATVEKVINEGEKEKTITTPTYKLTEYKMPVDNPEMPDPELIEDYRPREILNEFIDTNDGIKKYTVEGIYLGKTDLESWTEDEFDKPENKFLLEEWNKKKEEEMKMKQMYQDNFSTKRKIKKILDVEIDEKGSATFKCILLSSKNTDPIMITEKMMWGAKTKVDKFMTEQGYKRGPNSTWTKELPKQKQGGSQDKILKN